MVHGFDGLTGGAGKGLVFLFVNVLSPLLSESVDASPISTGVYWPFFVMLGLMT